MFIILPVFCFLTLTGLAGFLSVRKVLIAQWGGTALARLEKAAHNIDMELNRPKHLLSLLDGMSRQDFDNGVHHYIIRRLENIPGVKKVTAQWPGEMKGQKMRMQRQAERMGMRMPSPTEKKLEVTTPTYTVEFDRQKVFLRTQLVNMKDSVIGEIEVQLNFQQLIEPTIQSDWWNISKVCIVDSRSNILAETTVNGQQAFQISDRKFGQSGDLEKKTLTALLKKSSGIVFGKGIPPEEISGFYHLVEAPWTMVIMTPGKQVLQPLITFSRTYIIITLSCIVFLLWYILSSLKKTTQSIRQVSTAAQRLAEGKFSEPLRVSSKDEVGELLHSFNTMTCQLKRRLQLEKAMEIAKEVQMTFLPQADYADNGIKAGGISIYCDETGGDYFDFIESETQPGKLYVAVGDVVGHGIGAALLMATIRSLVRARVHKPGSAAERITDINRYLCRDTLQYGNFCSLFYLEIEPEGNMIHWIRAGHEPALLFTPADDSFQELMGGGLVLGLDSEMQYTATSLPLMLDRYLLVIGSDGVWEQENEQQEPFGKERIRDLIRKYQHLEPSQILQHITEAIHTFRGNSEQADDITLVIISLVPDSLKTQPLSS